MKVEHPIYEDGVIAVVLLAENASSAKRSLFQIALRYLPPQSYVGKDGNTVKITNWMGGETDWFIVPYSFGVAIAKSLIEQHVSGLSGFSEDGFGRMVSWLVEMEEVSDAMCY